MLMKRDACGCLEHVSDLLHSPDLETMLHQGLNVVSQLQLQLLLLRPLSDQLCQVLGLLPNLADQEGDNDWRYPILLCEILLGLTADDGPVGDV